MDRKPVTELHLGRCSRCGTTLTLAIINILGGSGLDPRLPALDKPSGPNVPWRPGRDIVVNGGIDVYTDANYAREETRKRDMSGDVLIFGGECLPQFSWTRKYETLSKTEVAYVIIGDGVKGAPIVQNLLSSVL